MSNKLAKTSVTLLLTALLTVPAAAAQLHTDWDVPCSLACADFTDSGSIQGIYVTEVPANSDGSFYYGSRVLRAGDVLSVSALDQITLRSAAQADQELTLTYCPIQDNRLGQPAALTVCVSDGKTDPPVAEDTEFETYKNVANNGQLKFSGGAEGKMRFTITKEPKRGTITIAEDGTFLYTPNKNKVGKDSFRFTVTDAAGGTSNEATVSVRILKPTDAATYADLDGDIDQFEAMWLQNSGLYAGKALAGQSCFEPNQAVSRGDFLVMVMELADIQPDCSVAASGFTDETDAPAWMRPYLTAALRSGIVTGIQSDAGLVFQPNEPITCAQAAVLLQNVLNLPQPETTEVFAADPVVPAWAERSVNALSHARICLDCADYDRPLTRREAANLLYAADQLL